MKTKKILAWTVLTMLAISGCNNASAKTADSAAPKTEAEGWTPQEGIEIVVGNSAGGGADLFTREVVSIIDQYKMCPQNITVVNKPGSSHVAGYTYMLQQGGDYCLDVTSASFFTQPISGNSPFKFDDFSYIAMLCKDPNLLFAAKNAPFTDYKSMVAYAKEHPGEVLLAGSSAYSDDAIICYMIRELEGVDITYVTYESGADVLAAVMGGHVQLGILNPAEVGDNISAGNVAGIAVSAEKRVTMPGMENIQTFAELGVDIDHEQPRGFVMSKDADPEAAAYYSDLFKQVAETPEWKEYLEEQCMEPEFHESEDWTTAKDEYVNIYTEYVNMILKDTK